MTQPVVAECLHPWCDTRLTVEHAGEWCRKHAPPGYRRPKPQNQPKRNTARKERNV